MLNKFQSSENIGLDETLLLFIYFLTYRQKTIEKKR